MTIPALFVVLLAIPVLLSGEFLVKRIRLLSRFNIPAPVVGGLLVSLLVLLGNLSGQHGQPLFRHPPDVPLGKLGDSALGMKRGQIRRRRGDWHHVLVFDAALLGLE